MTIKTITSVRFLNYWNLIKTLRPGIDMVMVFNDLGSFIWQSCKKLHPQMSHITSLVMDLQKDPPAEHAKLHSHALDGGITLELHLVTDPKLEDKLIVAILVDNGLETESPSADTLRESVKYLNRTLLNEFSLTRIVIEKEKELEDMAEELTHRYEELNLIYASDDHVQNLSHGRELLQHIVNSASNHLDVDLSIIVLPEKNINVMQGQDILSANHYELIQRMLVDEIYSYQKTHKSPLVLNNRKDAMGLNIALQIPYKFMVAPILNADSEVIGLMAIINRNRRIDFTNSDRNLMEVLNNKASNIVLRNFDPLTGLENKHSFELILSDTLKQSWQNDSFHAVADIDIDRMAVINDISGHQAGDRLIKLVGNKILSMVRSCDTVARLGGDKFSVLLKNCSLEKARNIMSNLAQSLDELKLEWDKDVHEVSISIGLTPITSDIRNISTIMTNAESARLAAKARGRNQIQVFTLDDKDLAVRKEQIKWVGKTQNALRDNRLELFAQLIHPIAQPAVIPHFEILLRLRDEEGNIVPPGLFLPAAETFYLMPQLDRWVIANTFMQLHEFNQRYNRPCCQVSINLSGQSFAENNLGDYITGLMHEYQIDPGQVCFEVTESTAVANLKEAQKFIRFIRKLGCQFSLDDFGTGYSSFAYLRNFDVNYLKIDGSFVRNVDTDDINRSMVSAINQVGHSMQLKTIAEFVENDSILDCLATLGIDYAQGYGINKPQPFAQQIEQLGLVPDQPRKIV